MLSDRSAVLKKNNMCSNNTTTHLSSPGIDSCTDEIVLDDECEELKTPYAPPSSKRRKCDS